MVSISYLPFSNLVSVNGVDQLSQIPHSQQPPASWHLGSQRWHHHGHHHYHYLE